MKKLTIVEIRVLLAKEDARHRQIEREGAKALSRYDIEIAHGGDAEQAVRTALRLVDAHIHYYKKQLESIVEQLSLDI